MIGHVVLFSFYHDAESKALTQGKEGIERHTCRNNLWMLLVSGSVVES